MPNSSDVQPVFDQAWIQSERKRLGLADHEIEHINIAAREDELFLLNDRGEKIGSFHEIIKSMFPKNFIEMPETPTTHSFTEPTFITTGNDRFPRVKLTGIKATIWVKSVDQELIFNAEDFIAFVLHEVSTGKSKLINKDNRPLN